MQRTSLEAYEKAKENINQSQSRVLGVFYAEPFVFDWTNAEIARRLGWSINRVTPRMLELRKMGILGLTTPRKCKVTGNRAMAWRVVT